MSSSDPFSGAGVTALGLAASRSVESSRTDRLLDDPHARSLFERAGASLPMRTEWPADEDQVSDTEALHLHGSRYIGVRTRFYDDRLVEAAAAGLRQVVLLGAGLDTRGQRLALPADLTIFEVDRDELLAWKSEALAALGAGTRCIVRRVGGNLAAGWAEALASAGFDRGLPSLWIAEGALPYLDASAQERLVSDISELSAVGSTLCFDQIRGGDTAALSSRSGLDMKSMLTSTDGEARTTALLTAAGWHSEVEQVEAVAATFGRDLSDPLTAPGDAGRDGAPWLDTVFVTAVR